MIYMCLLLDMLITFEGGEGTGKSSTIQYCQTELLKKGIPCITTRDPGGTTIGNDIRKILLHPESTQLSLNTELLLYNASRAQLVSEIIELALSQKQHVLCDRYILSTYVYQGYVKQVPIELISQIESFFSFPQPILTILFDCDPSISLPRAKARSNIQESRFEQETIDFHQKVRRGYLEFIQDRSLLFIKTTFVKIDASLPEPIVHDSVLSLLLNYLGKS